MKKYRITAILLAALLSCLSFAGCGAPSSSRTAATGDQAPTSSGTEPAGDVDGEPRPLRVVSTIFPPYDFVREIAGDKVELTMLLRPGAESHSFDPSPQDMILIGECDLFIYIGGDNDVWVETLLASIDRGDLPTVALVDLADAVEEELVEGMEHGHDHDEDEDHDDHEHDDERELDEHVWTSPVNAARIVEALCETLGELDPANAAAYRANTADYVAELHALDADFREMVESAARRTVIFGDRFPFRYLADEYGLEYYAAFPGCSTETEASPATVAFLIDKVRDEGLPVVFHIELSNQKMADTICGDSGAGKLLLHSCHNVTRDEFEAGATYLSLMRQNLENLREALN